MVVTAVALLAGSSTPQGTTTAAIATDSSARLHAVDTSVLSDTARDGEHRLPTRRMEDRCVRPSACGAILAQAAGACQALFDPSPRAIAHYVLTGLGENPGHIDLSEAARDSSLACGGGRQLSRRGTSMVNCALGDRGVSDKDWVCHDDGWKSQS
jgi:hypothetical protein